MKNDDYNHGETRHPLGSDVENRFKLFMLRRALWRLACEWDSIARDSQFVAFDVDNPWVRKLNAVGSRNSDCFAPNPAGQHIVGHLCPACEMPMELVEYVGGPRWCCENCYYEGDREL